MKMPLLFEEELFTNQKCVESSSTRFVTIKIKTRNPGRFCEIIPML